MSNGVSKVTVASSSVDPMAEFLRRCEERAKLARQHRLSEAKSPEERAELEEMFRTEDALTKASGFRLPMDDMGGG